MTTTPEEREKIVQQYTPMVWKLAIQQFTTGIGRNLGTVEDCVQVGMMALLDSIDKFDPERGCKFITYAYPAVARRIYQVANNTHGLIHVPGYTIPAAKDDANQSGRARDARRALSVNSRCIHDKWECNLPAPPEPEPHEGVTYDERVKLADAMRRLTPRERRVLLRTVGDGLTYEEVGAELGVSKERVRQIRNEALRKARRESL